ncbi:agmatine deiminase [Pedobacter sp. UYP30]|uniref:agmatine deiminase family protein n=1 Tax=Pedobacter sp. UYP30 TaxID=1756400 RepID=UPI003393FE94
MITDSQANFIYLADSLPLKYPAFYAEFQKVLNKAKIAYGVLPQTKDVWAVDYMPIQVDENEFIKFNYAPDYLMDSIKWKKTISDVDLICSQINIELKKSSIILDGGNVVRSEKKIIMCDKIFFENPLVAYNDLIAELKNIFQIDDIIFIPTHPKDKIGHADGILRFYGDNTVLINEFSKEDKKFEIGCKTALSNAGVGFIEIPYNPYGNSKGIDATGIYINYLELGQTIILPTFNILEDEKAIRQFETLFPKHQIISVHSSDLAKDGGVLNCITWNILRVN